MHTILIHHQNKLVHSQILKTYPFIMTNTLYQRMGGDSKVELAVEQFLVEIGRSPELLPFFENISVSALGVHQIKLFRVLFGPEEERPDRDEFLTFMLATHTRLFREMGLNEHYFDLVADCLVCSFQKVNYSQEIIDDCLVELAPLRIVFEYGAKVAAKEKTYDTDQLANLPTASASSIETEEPTVLPDPAWIDIPDWLPETLERYSANGVVRSWTKDLIDRFGVDGDKVIADCFLDAPYMNHHVYACAMMQLAFLPEDASSVELLDVVLYPRGPDKGLLWGAMWERMIDQFKDTCDYMMMDADMSQKAVNKLLKYKKLFRKGEIKLVGGLHTPHVLKRVVHAEFDVSAIESIKKKKSHGGSRASTGTDSITSYSEVSDAQRSARKIPGTRKSVWRRLLGWTKA